MNAVRRWAIAVVAMVAALARLSAPSAAHADTSSCTTHETCFADLTATVETYAASHDIAFSDIGPADFEGIAATLPGWTYSLVPAFNMSLPTDPMGNHYYFGGETLPGSGDNLILVESYNDADLNFLGDLPFTGEPARWTSVLDVTTGEAVFPLTELDGTDPADAVHNAAFYLFSDLTEAAVDHSFEVADLTGADLLNNNPYSYYTGLATVVSGPAGGPWTFKITDALASVAAAQGCEVTYSAASSGLIKFDSSPCWTSIPSS